MFEFSKLEWVRVGRIVMEMIKKSQRGEEEDEVVGTR
jgi:hypothetical protein